VPIRSRKRARDQELFLATDEPAARLGATTTGEDVAPRTEVGPDGEQIIYLEAEPLSKAPPIRERQGIAASPWAGPPSSSAAATERAAAYSAWAARMKAKREQTRSAADRNGTAQPTYWTTDALFAESVRVAEDQSAADSTGRKVAELLAVLQLPATATPEQVGDAYRRLAKAHHPDRFIDADAATQRLHDDQMRRVNQAYRALKQLDRA
jgi:DnaJ-domain-containing protein 1